MVQRPHMRALHFELRLGTGRGFLSEKPKKFKNFG